MGHLLKQYFTREDGAAAAFAGYTTVVASIFTPYQLMFLERLWALLASPPRLMLIDSRPERFRTGRPAALPAERCMSLPLTGKVNDPEQAALIRSALASIDDFAAGKPLAFVCASYQWPINTAAYRRYRGQGGNGFFLIEDGLSTYLDIRPSPRERLRNCLREVVARLRGFPPRAFVPGHPLGLDLPEIAAIFMGIERIPEGAGHRPYLTLPPHDGAGLTYSPDAAVFVGQPYLRDHGALAVSRLIAGALADLRARGYRRLAFKPHHYQSAEEVQLYLDAGFELYDPPVAVEEILAASEFRTLAAINSTALLNVKSLFGDAVRAIAYDAPHFAPRHEDRDEARVLAIFREAGVEMVDLQERGGR